MGATACGGGSGTCTGLPSGTTPGNYVITVTGTSGLYNSEWQCQFNCAIEAGSLANRPIFIALNFLISTEILFPPAISF